MYYIHHNIILYFFINFMYKNISYNLFQILILIFINEINLIFTFHYYSYPLFLIFIKLHLTFIMFYLYVHVWNIIGLRSCLGFSLKFRFIFKGLFIMEFFNVFLAFCWSFGCFLCRFILVIIEGVRVICRPHCSSLQLHRSLAFLRFITIFVLWRPV